MRSKPALVATLAVAANLLASGALRASANPTSVSGTLTIDGARTRNAVVVLRGGPAGLAVERESRATMGQRNLTFRPHVLPVARGTTIDFPNEDDVQHNVFSSSKDVAEFDLGTYGRGQSRDVRVDRTGEIRVLCNIHMEMEAKILVLDDPYFVVTRADGGFRINNVEPGEYSLAVWHDGWLPHTQPISVSGAADIDVQVNATR